MLRFSGRDARGLFWRYAIFIFLAASAISYIAMIPELMRMAEDMTRIILEQRDVGSPSSAEATSALIQDAMPDFGFLILATLIVDIVAAALLAAAVTRRLHDRDLAGYWGLLPLPSVALGFVLAPELLTGVLYAPGGGQRDMTVAMWASLNSVVIWGLLIFLIVLLAREGTDGPNRFGPAPEPEPGKT